MFNNQTTNDNGIQHRDTEEQRNKKSIFSLNRCVSVLHHVFFLPIQPGLCYLIGHDVWYCGQTDIYIAW